MTKEISILSIKLGSVIRSEPISAQFIEDIENRGLICPITVRKLVTSSVKKYKLLDGRLRLAACKRLGMTTIMARIVD